jgi:hypothetical protein
MYTLYAGLITTTLGALMVGFDIGYNEEFILTTGIYISIISSIALCALIYRIWKFVLDNKPENERFVPVISANKAVGYLFIPFYNLYWMFLSIGKMAEEVRSISENSQDNETLSTSRGKIICYFMLAGVVPILGTILTLVASYILLPKYLKQIIHTKNSIESSKGIEYKPSLHLLNGTNNSINFKLATYLIIACFSASFLHNILSNLGAIEHSISNLIFEILKETPSYAMVGLFFVFLLHYIKSLDALALSVGVLFSAISKPMLNTGFHIHYLALFLIGISLIYSLNKYLKQDGLRFKSVLKSMLITIGIATLAVGVYSQSAEKIFLGIIYSILTIPVYSLAYFKGLKQ